MTTVEKINVPLCQLGEGLYWDKKRNTMWWLDIEGYKIHSINHQTLAVQTWDTEKFIGMITMTDTGDLLAFADNEIMVFNPDTNSYTQLSDDFTNGAVDVLSNDGKADRNGDIVIGTKHTTCAKPTASLYHFQRGQKQGTELRKNITVCNGPAFSPCGTKMYFADTPTQIIDVYDYNNGAISNQKTFAHYTGDGLPDGMTVDAHGYLWNALWNGHCIRRYAPDGTLERTLEIPKSLNITTVCFGGDDLKTLYITSAYSGMTDEQRQNYPDSGALFRVHFDDIHGMADAPFVIT